MEYSKFAEPLVMYYLDKISRHFGVALIKRVNLHEYNYSLDTPLIDIFGTQENVNAFLQHYRDENIIDPARTFENAKLVELPNAMFELMDPVSVMYPNIGEIYYDPNRSRLEISFADSAFGRNVVCDENLKNLIVGWFNSQCGKIDFRAKLTKTVVLGIDQMHHLQSFFPDDYKFDHEGVYELFPINGLSDMVKNVSIVSPSVVMQRNRPYISVFTFNGYVVRLSLKCLQIRSLKRQ